MWENLFAAIALVLVIEGMIPFINPGKWRYYIKLVAEQPDRVLRIMGLVSMLAGASILFIVRAID